MRTTAERSSAGMSTFLVAAAGLVAASRRRQEGTPWNALSTAFYE